MHGRTGERMKAWLLAGLAAAVLAVVFLAGMEVGKLEGTVASVKELKDRGDTIQALAASNSQLLLGIAAQNQAVAVAEAKADSAKETTRVAQAYAADMAKLSESRMSKIEKALKDAKTVGEVLSRYWELRQ